MTKLGRPPGRTYEAEFSLRLTREDYDRFLQLWKAIAKHNQDPDLKRSHVVRAVFLRGIQQLSDELAALKATRK